MNTSKPELFACVLFLLPAALIYSQTTSAALPQAGQILDQVTDSRPLPNGIELHAGQAVMQLTALREDVLRVRVSATSRLPEDASWAVLPGSRTASVDVMPESIPNAIGFRTAKLHISISRSSLGLTVTDNAGNILSRDLPGRPIEFHHTNEGNSFRVYKESPADEHYFGLGDKPGPLDRRNEAFTDWNTDAFEWQESTDPIYKSIPFVMTLRKGIATGLFFDNTWRASFDFNKEYRDGWSFGAENGPLDYYILYGPSPKAVVEDWAWLVGTTPMPPLWSLGFQQSRYSYYPETEVRRIAHTLRADNIPADVLWLDIDYQDRNRPFTVNPERFPHFVQMLSDLRAEHLHTVLITDLHIAGLPGYKPYDEGHAGDHFVKNPDGTEFVGPVWPGPAVFPDFTRRQTREWWGTLYTDFVHQGAAGFWNDMNEPSVFHTPTLTMPDDTQHRIDEPGFLPRTASHLEIHNIFGMENSRATFDGLLKLQPNTRPFVMTRASYAGGQRYAATWTGDNSSTWNHLRQTIPQLINLSLSGFSMSGADVGGFAGSPPPDLLTLWLEVAAFQPIDRDHTSSFTYPQEPWEDGTAHDLELRRRYIEQRYRLMSYLYTVAEEMSRTGLPMMRPLFLEFPEATSDRHPIDLNTHNSFLLGPDLLIATSPYPERRDDYSISLPPVGWYDYWTGERVSQPKLGATRAGNDNIPDAELEVKIHPSLENLPVFVRAGAILPIQPLVQSTEEKPIGPLTLRVYPPLRPGGECRGSIYLDDGVSYAFRRGDFLREHFSCTTDVSGLKVTVSPREGSFKPWWSELHIEVAGHSDKAVNVRDNGRGTTVRISD